MKKIEPILAKNQPLLWKQAIRQAEAQHRGYSKRNILLSPIIEHTFPFKNHLSYRFDHLILGSNPILIYLLLLRLHDATLSISGQDPIKIGILFTDDIDYWGYHSLEKKDFWMELEALSAQKWGSSFSKLLERRKDLFLDSTQHNLTFIDSYNMSINNCIYDKYIDGYILHMKDKEKQLTTSYTEQMPTLINSEYALSLQYKEQLLSFFNKLSFSTKSNINQLSFPNKKTSCADNPLSTHLLLSSHIWLTSQPTGWIKSEIVTKDNTIIYDDEEIKETIFGHLLSNNSFGTAKHIANDFYGLEKQTIFDMLTIRKVDREKFLSVKESNHENN